MNLDDLFQLLNPRRSSPIERERHLREEMESWEQRAFSLNAAIGLLRAALQIAQQQEQALQQQRTQLQAPQAPDDTHLSLGLLLTEQARHRQHLHTYTLRALYQQLMEQKKQLLQQGQERLLPVIDELPPERKERMHRLFQQSLEGIQNVSVARQETTALRELEEQLQRPLEEATSTHQEASFLTPMTFEALETQVQQLLQNLQTSHNVTRHTEDAVELKNKGADD
ncbi:MAG: hypothetical protein H6728_11590 [Myxococcales bacterium]|nr:hypothetical protein [Myxococcales bacterium]